MHILKTFVRFKVDGPWCVAAGYCGVGTTKHPHPLPIPHRIRLCSPGPASSIPITLNFTHYRRLVRTHRHCFMHVAASLTKLAPQTLGDKLFNEEDWYMCDMRTEVLVRTPSTSPGQSPPINLQTACSSVPRIWEPSFQSVPPPARRHECFQLTAIPICLSKIASHNTTRLIKKDLAARVFGLNILSKILRV